MKKFLLMFSTVLMLIVCLCVPAFAADCDDCGTPLTPYSCDMHICAEGCGTESPCHFDDYGICTICGYSVSDVNRDHYFIGSFCEYCGYEKVCDHSFESVGIDFHVCKLCGLEAAHDFWCPDASGYHECMICCVSFDCSDIDADSYCDVCGHRDPLFGSDYCGCFDFSSLIIFYGEDDHYAFCPEHLKIISFASLDGSALPHIPDSCDVCSSFTDSVAGFFPYSAYTSGALYCENFLDVLSGDNLEALFSGKFAFLYDDMTHYASCLDCGAYCDFSVLAGPVPHTGSDCELCSEFSVMGITPSPFPSESPDSSSVLSSITDLVGASVGWITAFVLCIMSNSLLLIFIVSILAILGLYLLKRSIHL